MSVTDRIEKEIVVKAPVARVWRAIANSSEFGEWFGMKFDQPFTPGQKVTANFVRKFDEEKISAWQRSLGLEPSGIRMPVSSTVFCTVERMDPERYFSFRWVPFFIDAECDPEQEPTTLVEFLLEPINEGTRLKVVESGFDRVPAHRRERAFRMNDGGWGDQVENIKRYAESS